MRSVQNTLLIVGCLVTLAISCAFGLAYVGDLVLFRARPGEHGTGAWGSYYGAVLCFVLGALCGAIFGLTIAVACIARSGGELWKAPTWLGIGIGVVLGLVLRFVMSVSDGNGMLGELILRYWLASTVLLTVTGTFGGFAGFLVESLLFGRIGSRDRSRRS